MQALAGSLRVGFAMGEREPLIGGMDTLSHSCILPKILF